MEESARISWRGASLVLPVKDPYDRQLAFEHAEHCGRHREGVTLHLDGTNWRVAACGAQGTVFCASCGNRIRRVAYSCRQQMLCARCTSDQAVTSRHLRMPPRKTGRARVTRRVTLRRGVLSRRIPDHRPSVWNAAR